MGGCAARSRVEVHDYTDQISIHSNKIDNHLIDNKNIFELFDKIFDDIENNDFELKHFRQRFDENHIKINELIDINIINHKFIFLLKQTLFHILIKWNSSENDILNENEIIIFRNISKFFYEITQCFNQQTSPKIYQLFFSTIPFIDIMKQCLDNMALNGKHLNEDSNLQSFTYLLNTFRSFPTNSNHLIDEIDSLFVLILSVSNILRSNYYFQTFLQFSYESSKFNSIQDFLLDKCPLFIIAYKGKSSIEIHDTLLEQTFDQYIEILEHFLPYIDSWSTSIIRVITHIIDIMINASSTTQIHLFEQPKLIDYALIIVKNEYLCSNLDSPIETPQIWLINSILTGLHNMIYNSKLLAILKRKTMTNIFLDIATKASYDRIQIHSYLILAGILSEEEIQKLNNSKDITNIFFKYLNKAMKSQEHIYKGVTLFGILSGLKTLVQHEEIKDAIQNEDTNLELLSEIIFKTNNQELAHALSILWTLSFNKNVALTIRKNTILIDRIRILAKNNKSNGKESIKIQNVISSAAEGILWEIEDEITLREQKQTEIKKVIENELNHSPFIKSNSTKQKYDIMISYSHDDKQIIHKIADCLVNDGFNIWIDKNNITGSTPVAIADGIENSEIILIGMTFSYKISPWCQREGNYAFQRQTKIIPLKLPPAYIPDGWLGLLLTNLNYINFVKFNFDIAYEQLKKEIQLHKQQQTNLSQINSSNLPIINEILLHQDEYVYPPQSNGLYEKIPIENWTNENVKDFLNDKKLYPFILLCKDMNGSSLYELYKFSNQNSSLAFESLQKQLSNKYNYHDLSPIEYSRFISEIKSFTSSTTQSRLCIVM